MEAQTDIQTYLEQGRLALGQGQGREAAIAYAHGAQLEPDNPAVHLGLAEANLALGNYGVVGMACRKVQELQPQGGIEAKLAQAILDLLDRRYERALQSVDAVISEDPGLAYAHAMRAYLLRALGQDYDANLARARSTRLSYGGRFDRCFPEIEPSPYKSGYEANANTRASTAEQPVSKSNNTQQQTEREPIPTWSRPNPMRRQIIRTRFALNQYPGMMTYILIFIYVLVFLVTMLIPEAIVNYGAQTAGSVLGAGQVWRVLTTMFLYSPSNLFPLLISMLSLYFVGRGVEIFYGPLRYLAIFLLTGVVCNIIFLFLLPFGASSGASWAIFGIFGALGVFYLVNRRSLGAYGSGAFMSWIFWLVLNIAFSFSAGLTSIIALFIALVVGMVIAFLLLPRSTRGRSLL